VISVWLNVPDAHRDRVIAELWEAGTTGITEEGGVLRAFFESEIDLDPFAQFQPQASLEAEHDWVKESQDQWQPFAVGERFFLVPEWRDDPAPAGRIRLTMHPGLACGSGTHPATRLGLMGLEKHLIPSARLLDVGTGSGILAVAAKLLGASCVVGCDIEHDATEVARGNFLKDGVTVPVFTGSMRSVRSSSIDVVVANLNRVTFEYLDADLQRVLRAGGLLIASGFREDETDSVASGWRIMERMELDDWGGLVCRR
jgi:ribosomal protein L11 methyltransferase